MHISSSSIIASSFAGVSNTSSRKSLADQYPKPVTIEGQTIDDNDAKKQARKLERENLSADQTKYDSTEHKTSDENQQLVSSSPDAKSEQLGGDLLLQKKLGSASAVNNLSNSLNPEQIENKAEHTFPYTNRRSSNGLAGGSLIIQKYLNNEPETSYYSGQSLIDRFI